MGCPDVWLCVCSEEGRVLLTKTLFLSTRGSARKARLDKFEFDEGFLPYHPPFRTRCDRVAESALPKRISILWNIS